jgi:hypothetical protein
MQETEEWLTWYRDQNRSVDGVVALLEELFQGMNGLFKAGELTSLEETKLFLWVYFLIHSKPRLENGMTHKANNRG